MPILIIRSHISNPPHRLTRKVIPRVGIYEAARQIEISKMDGFAVRERGLLDPGLESKIPWSRLTAYHLRRINVLEVSFCGENTAEMLKALTAARDLKSLQEQRPGVTVVDLSTEEGELEYIRHPLARSEKILYLVNRSSQGKSVIRTGFERLRQEGKLELSRLSAWALINLGPELEDPADLKYALENVSNSAARIEIFKKLKSRGLVKLPELSDKTLAVVFPELGKGDHPYLAERMTEALKKAKGEEIGWEFIRVLKRLEKDKEPEIQALMEQFRKDHEALVRRRIEEQAAEQAKDLDPDDFKGTGGTPSDIAGIPGRF